MAKNSENKPIYKKWWFWLIAIILVIALTNCGNEEDEPETSPDETEEITNEPGEKENTEEKEEAKDTEEEPAQEENPEENEPTTRDNSSAKQTVLNTGRFVVGPDIPAGRYTITGDGSGNFFVYDGEIPEVNEILDPTGEFGVKTLTTDLKEGQEVEISGINNVTFTPAITELQTSLSAGNWVVGLDIEEGRYDVTTPSGSGNFFVYNSIGLPEVNEILDASGDFGVQKLTVNLEEGQTISISGLNTVDFTAK